MNTFTHIGAGLLIATLLGFRGKKRWGLGFLAILPDFDILTGYLLDLIDAITGLDHETYNFLFYLMEHREFSHSLLFIVLVSAVLHIALRNNIFTFASFTTLFSHFLLDYFTTWKMRALYPISLEGSTMGVLYFFDPVVNILAISFIPLVLISDMKDRGKLSGRLDRLHLWFEKRLKRLSGIVLVNMVLYVSLMTGGKIALIDSIGPDEEIPYQYAYPISYCTYLSGHSHNESHYRVLKADFFRGVTEEEMVPKVFFDNITVEEGENLSSRVIDLYSGHRPEEIDLPAVSIWKEENGTIVELYDARARLIDTWAYFRPIFRFHFEDDGYWVEVKWPNPSWTRVPNEHFERG
ncbi:MAG: metal-dependent hydrolase [Thermoplasmatota archaeon]